MTGMKESERGTILEMKSGNKFHVNCRPIFTFIFSLQMESSRRGAIAYFCCVRCCHPIVLEVVANGEERRERRKKVIFTFFIVLSNYLADGII